ncbi:hypothetical protein Leryth_005983 [Lithospermum erythrorhizon]|nr:hypothetical protein Leryth_005983 [Lithospermum erythrorhizon]
MMSLNALKETLKPCNNSLPSSKSSNSSILDIINTRKPPKSSLYKQLLRLEETTNEDETCNNHKQEAVEEDQQPKRIPPKLDTHPIGPYDPLLLSQNPIVHVPASINCRLMMHQREGVKFLYTLYRNNHGGVLGDDMGLGKTIQTIAFLAAVFGKDGDLGSTEREKKGPVLIVGPSSVIQNWLDEFSKWSTFDVSIYHGPNRDVIFRKLEANGVEVLITSFDTYRIHGSILSQIQWEIRATAPETFVRIADERKQHLVAVLGKYLLRRTKEETIGHLMMGKEDNVVFCAMSDVQKRVYQRMLQLPDVQCLVNKDLPCSCGSPLKQVECCKRTVPDGVMWPYFHKDNPEGCDSCPYCLVLPCLVKLQQISNHLELIKPNPKDDREKQRKDAEFASAVFGDDLDLVGGTTADESFMGLSDVKHCGKMRALEKLMISWASHGDKILLFSYSVRMLDILEKFLIRKGYSFSRLDGSTPTSLRQSLVDDFNSSPSKQVFLISTRAGGLGLNLVGANRVVIFDPNWNPAQDLQAQDRSFRFGQKRHVVVFRLLAAGSLEELVYSRQVYKQQLANIAVSGKMEKRYFEGVQDCKEFQGELFGICNLFRDLSDKLFTSEIIELHELQQDGHGHHGAKQNLTEFGLCFVPEEGRTSSEISYNENRKQKAVKPILEELGILYAHRNEDIVNYKPRIQENREGSMEHDDVLQQPPTLATWKRKSDVMNSRKSAVNSTCSKMQKKNQYRLLSQFKGMGELEFSRWVLSATPAARQKVLEEFKSMHRNMP